MSAVELEPVANPIQLVDSEVEFYNREGYLTLPGFLSATAVSGILDEVRDILDANGVSPEALASSTADKLRQYSQYLAGSRLDSLINGDATLEVASRLIGGPAVRYLPFTAVKAGGGGGTFHLHQDNSYTRHDPALGSINIWVALVDMTPENGCLQVMPRSHTLSQLDSRPSDDGDTHRQVDVDPLQCLPLRMHAGDAVAFTRWTVHGSGPNTTDSARFAYALQYHRTDVRWLDRDTDEWKLLTDTPRTATPPVRTLK
ncbi:MAG TPA: phytanoyl-CoA dioxygenase family protein [Mycobacteriales bacterium]|nr:phytanoyl-CoA dioxygenase family protein [Mycobacteriales bacterium]